MSIIALASSVVHVSGTTDVRTTTIEAPAGVETGDLLLIFCAMSDVSASTATLPAGWTQHVVNQAAGTMRVNLWSKVRAAGETTYDLSLKGTDSSKHVVVVIKNWDNTKALVVGSPGIRSANATALTTVAPSVNVVNTPSLALHFSSERTNSSEPEPTISNGFTRLAWAAGAVAPVGPVSILVSTKAISTPGAVGDVTTTYPNSSAANGFAIMVAVAEGVSAPPAVGQIKFMTTANFDHDYLTIGAAFQSGVSSAQCELYQGSTLVQTKPFVIAQSKWGHVHFEGLTAGVEYNAKVVINGVAQTDKTVKATTLQPGAPTSFKFVTGSCQLTGSNHPIWDRIRELKPRFLSHQGDLHYGNSTVLSDWRSFMESSLGASKFSAMTAEVPMHWQWDNHDRIIVDTLNLGTTDPATLASWRELAGYAFPFEDCNARTWVEGRVRFIVTDHWTLRDDPDLVPEPRTFLGAAQKQWFKDTLLSAKEPIIVWFDQWTGQNHANGRWNSFNSETLELEATINAHPGIMVRLILTGGDSHQINADSGTRTYEHRFDGMPNLNASGFNRSSTAIDPTGGWDIIDAALRTPEQSEADWGAYSRFTVEDDGATVTLRWEGVRVNASGVEDVMASWERKQGTVEIDGETCTLWGYNGVRSVPLAIEKVS